MYIRVFINHLTLVICPRIRPIPLQERSIPHVFYLFSRVVVCIEAPHALWPDKVPHAELMTKRCLYPHLFDSIPIVDIIFVGYCQSTFPKQHSD